MTQAPESIAALNDELLRKDHNPGSPRRNTKEFIIDKILAVADENHLELQVSNTKLKRMNKEKLQGPDEGGGPRELYR